MKQRNRRRARYSCLIIHHDGRSTALVIEADGKYRVEQARWMQCIQWMLVSQAIETLFAISIELWFSSFAMYSAACVRAWCFRSSIDEKGRESMLGRVGDRILFSLSFVSYPLSWSTVPLKYEHHAMFVGGIRFFFMVNIFFSVVIIILRLMLLTSRTRLEAQPRKWVDRGKKFIWRHSGSTGIYKSNILGKLKKKTKKGEKLLVAHRLLEKKEEKAARICVC